MQSESRRKRGRVRSVVPAVLILVLATSITVAQTPPGGEGPAGLVPSSAIMYVQTSRISSAVPAAVFFIGNLLPAENAKKIEAWRADFKTRAGVDVLDATSLAKAEIDVSRPAAMAYLDAKKESERIMILVPVKNEKTFPQRFVEVLKKLNRDKPALDLHPAISRHNDHAVYRMMKDVFFTGTKGYLVVASSMDIITSVLDTTARPLSAEPLFADYTAKKRAGNDLDIYLKKSFLQQIGEDRLKKKAEDADDSRADGDIAPDGEPGKEEPPAADDGASRRDPGDKDTLSMVRSQTDFFDYVAVAFARTKEGVSLDLSASLTGGNPSTALLAELRRLQAEGIDPAELRRAQEYLLGSQAISLQRGSERAATLAFNELYQLGCDAHLRYPAAILAVSAEGVRDVARRYLDLERYTLAVVKPQDARDAGIDAVRPGP